MSDAEILFDRRGGLGVITLNRPKALNALSMGMVRELERMLPAWESDPSVQAVVIRGAGGRAFCAGGDVASLAREARDEPNGTMRRDFFREEYIVNRRIHRYAKPWISLIEGVDMGGGVGLTVHGTISVLAENFLFAMPETAIGLFPDVGGGYFLTRLQGALGVYLALSGARLKAADAIWCGIGNVLVPQAQFDALTEALAGADLSGEKAVAARKARAVIDRFAVEPEAPALPAQMADIDRCFSADTVEEMVAKLKALGNPWAEATLKLLSRMSPISMKVTLEQLKRCANRSMEDTLTIEYRLSQACMKPGHDFFEGVRAVLIDKDQKPKWNPPTLEAATDAMVEEHFKPVANDLTF